MIQRYYYLDSMRSILMVLGVVLHSAQIYNPKQSWAIYSENTIPLAGYLVSFINTFRMPTFFVIAGFFCLLTFEKYNLKGFLLNKARRILVPLVSTAVFVNSIQIYILSRFGWYDFDFFNYIYEKKFISHLWFLNNLIVYFFFTALVLKLFNSFDFKFFLDFRILNNKYSVYCLVIFMPLFSIFILSLNKLGFPLYDSFGVFSYYILLKYLPYYLFGLLAYKKKHLLSAFSEVNLSCFSVLVVALFIFKMSEFSRSIAMGKVVGYYLDGVLVWAFIVLIFCLFMRYFDSENKYFRYLSDASYTIYLFHHIIVVSLGLLFLKFELSPYLSILIIISLTSIATVLIHNNFIGKISLARNLFNGR